MENNIVKKLFLLPFMDILLLLVTSRANNISKTSNTDLTAEKYTEIIKNLKKELSSINDVSWNFKKSNDVTNADISKVSLIEVFPKNEKDSLSLMDTYISLGSKDKEAKSTIAEPSILSNYLASFNIRKGQLFCFQILITSKTLLKLSYSMRLLSQLMVNLILKIVPLQLAITEKLLFSLRITLKQP